MKTRILVLSYLLVALACDKVERDWNRCNEVNKCDDNHACIAYRCVPKDAGLDTPPIPDGSSTRADTVEDRPLVQEAGSDVMTDAEGLDIPQTALDALADLPADVPVADARLTCSEDQDCPAEQPLCAGGVCVQCRSHDDCTQNDGGTDDGDGGATAGGFCNLQNQCVGCLSHADCQDPSKPLCGENQTCVACDRPAAPKNGCLSRNSDRPVCRRETGTCEECVRSSDCTAKAGDAGISDARRDGGAAGKVCSEQNLCVECNLSSDCTADPARPLCVKNACMGCGSADGGVCTGEKPLCATSGGKAGQCVECTSNAHCPKANAPICESNQCRGCKKDSECSGQAGVCGLDGVCPPSNLVVYAQNSSKCTSSNRGQGTSDFPYCDLDNAVSRATENGSVVRVIGTVVPATALIINASKPLLIVGQTATSAIINPPASSSGPVVTIAGGDVTLRDLTITAGRGAGVSASAGTIHVNRCYVLNNAGTGIDVGNGVAFDISNTVIAGNGLTSGSGVTLGWYTGTGPVRFEFNTVVNNGNVGVVCATGYALTGILANNNGVLNISADCKIDSTSTTAEPGFSNNFHLTSSSPCVNAGGPRCPTDDIDGEVRPKGAACDCGADEF